MLSILLIHSLSSNYEREEALYALTIEVMALTRKINHLASIVQEQTHFSYHYEPPISQMQICGVSSVASAKRPEANYESFYPYINKPRAKILVENVDGNMNKPIKFEGRPG